jgi:hypothetical protein
MTKRKSMPDRLEAEIEDALQPGWFMDYRDTSGFVSSARSRVASVAAGSRHAKRPWPILTRLRLCCSTA